MARAQLFVLGTDMFKVMVWMIPKINEARVEGAEDLSRTVELTLPRPRQLGEDLIPLKPSAP